MAEDGAYHVHGVAEIKYNKYSHDPVRDDAVRGTHARSASRVSSKMRRSARDHEVHEPTADEQPREGRVRPMEADSEPDGAARGRG
jgi:hypothetical protein